MKNINDQVKMKVLAQLRNHMDSRMAERLKPKKPPEVNAVKVGPVTDSMSAGMPGPTAGQKPDMDDEDTSRLMSLYSSLK